MVGGLVLIWWSNGNVLDSVGDGDDIRGAAGRVDDEKKGAGEGEAVTARPPPN